MTITGPSPAPSASAAAPQPRSASRFEEVIIHAEDAFAALDAEFESPAPAAAPAAPPPAQAPVTESVPPSPQPAPPPAASPAVRSAPAANTRPAQLSNEGPKPANRLQTARFAREVADLLIRRSALNRQLRIVSPDGAMAAPAVDQIRLHDWSIAALRGLRVSLEAGFSSDEQSLQTALREAVAAFGFQLKLADESPDLMIRAEIRRTPDVLSQGWHIKTASLHVNIIDREEGAVLQSFEISGKQSSQIPEEASRRLWKFLASKIPAAMENALGAALK